MILEQRFTLMSAHDTALLVIDVQQSFLHRPYFDAADVPAFMAAVQALVDGAVRQSIPVLQVFHVEKEGVFSLASGHVQTLSPLAIKPTAIFHKQRHSALVGSGLDVWLVEHGIRRLIVAGIRTEQCCETTTRQLSDFGYQVDFVSDATLTFPMTNAAGKVWTAADIKARTELVLADRFARIATVDQALAGAGMPIAA